ncbi:MAG: hypothetical protein AVDCRST_MAG22-977 [uncultured Rubrobacteraceae bacterium]|uniref:Uncharacterized protein n=1 Tax=uncultured Rubrobacteraceae bacterium TaxID=349277 RepID=A0A6J4NUW4_9ACTN|nr:MAG: hypothetical protein AVDCRST_MAG22-977 [uncultured Rubrobacteraceae bacterium]
MPDAGPSAGAAEYDPTDQRHPRRSVAVWRLAEGFPVMRFWGLGGAARALEPDPP